METTSWMGLGSMGGVEAVAWLAAGIAIGLGAGYALFPAIREAKRLREQLDRTLQDHETYKASVDAHFRKTADLVGQMTRSYAAVYDHLATGARAFCDDGSAGTALPFGPLPGALASPHIEAQSEPAQVRGEEESRGAATAAVPETAAESGAPDATSAGEGTPGEHAQGAAEPEPGTASDGSEPSPDPGPMGSRSA
jgi:uncharacterized membrane-anchored protein YhcB (DUF1043 family)